MSLHAKRKTKDYFVQATYYHDITLVEGIIYFMEGNLWPVEIIWYTEIKLQHVL